MWGSDFPVVASREGYGNAFRWSYQAFSEETKATKELIFGGTAQKVFKLPPKFELVGEINRSRVTFK